jgi:STE24 endopeptidase
MLLPFLLCLLILYTPLPPGGEAVRWQVTVAGVLLLAAINVLAAWVGSGLAVRMVVRSGRRGGMVAGRLFAALKGGVVGFVVADTFALHWPLLVSRLLGPHRWAVLVPDALLLLPAVVMLLTVAAFQHRVEASVRYSSLSLPRYLWLRFRVELAIILVPWLLWVAVTELTDAIYYNSPAARTADTVVTFGMLAVLLALSPALLRVIWPTSPLPDGPLRARLEAFCRAQHFRCAQILVWHTGHRLANAGVIGPTRLLRYVMMTDSMLDYCTEGEIAAVFAHEVGHARRHHLSFYMLFAVAFLCLYATLIDAGAALGWVTPLGDIFAFDMTLRQGIVLLAAALVYWALIFGFVSRRMEQEADLFAVRNVEEPQDFVTALEKLSALGGRPRAAAHWRHFSIARRVKWLQRVLAQPEVGVRFERRLRLLRLGIVAAFVVLLARLLIVRPGLFGL